MASSTNSKASNKKRSAKTWKRSGVEELTLPSENVCLARRPGPGLLLQKGGLPDPLMAIVQESIRDKKGLAPQKQADLAQDPKMLMAMLDSMDSLMPIIVVEPEVRFHKRPVIDPATEEQAKNSDGTDAFEDIPAEDRDEDVLYTDDVDLDDKMFLFQFAVGGTRDWKRFREQQLAGMGSVGAGEGAEGEAVGTAG